MSGKKFSQLSRKASPRLILLLQAASQGRTDLELATFDEEQTHWALKTGLGALLFHTTKSDPETAKSQFRPLLQSADLTARLIAAEQMAAVAEIIDACAGEGHVLTLLKGISICDQHYPEPHLRPMRDIDFLVEEADLPSVEALLFKLGYRQQSDRPHEFYQEHHHSMPFLHPQRGIWVEVHRGLFSPKGYLSSDQFLSLENIEPHLRLSEFRGRKVNRLSDELQIVYIASHWGRDFTVIGAMIAMLDIIYLLKNSQGRLRWEKIVDGSHGPAASAHLYLILTYLHKRRLIDVAPEMLRELSLRQRSLGNVNLKILHAVIDRYFVDGRTFGRVLRLRNLRILWRTLLLPRSPTRNLVLLPWNLLPSRPWTRPWFRADSRKT